MSGNGMVLGLDIGTTSIGWALCPEHYDPLDENIDIPCGVRIFPEGVNREKNKITEISKNQTRREKRLARRQLARRVQRREFLKSELVRFGFLPENGDEWLRFDPFELRKRALDCKLEKHELGRIFTHLNKRRGFKSNRKTDKAKDTGPVLTGISELGKNIEQSGARTLGEYLANLRARHSNPCLVSWREDSRHTHRRMLEDEFDCIVSKQTEYYSELERIAAHLKSIIFFQRPLKPPVLGGCSLEPGIKRSCWADWHAQEFRLLQEINHIRIHPKLELEPRSLNEKERDSLYGKLCARKEFPIDKIRSMLGLEDSDYLSLDKAKRKKLNGNQVEAAFSKKLKKNWEMADSFTREFINFVFMDFEDPLKLENVWKDRCIVEQTLEDMREQEIYGKLDNVDVENLCNQIRPIGDLSFADIGSIVLPERCAGFSLKAIKKLLPFLKQGLSVQEAILKAGYQSPSKRSEVSFDRLPLPESDIRNPIVRSAVFQVRKVVNAIVRKYGKPSKIVVELARDASGNKQKREGYLNRIKENEQKRSQAANALDEQFSIRQPSRLDIEKYLLWIECGKICPFTGKPISSRQLFSGEVEVEHIFPRSRSLDNSYMNKTLCFRAENAFKGNKTPYEAYYGSPRYDDILSRVHRLPYPKRNRFTQRELDFEGMIDRELNDTRYINKEILDYVRLLGVKVGACKGGVTAQIRHLWGLNSILNKKDENKKSRDDHRHHAVDAVVLAMARKNVVRDIARSFAEGKPVSFPWKTFRLDVERAVNSIVVSHRQNRKICGALHQETVYGRRKEKGYVYRRSIDNLTGAAVLKIIDPVVKKLVEQRCLEHGVDPKKFGSKTIPSTVFKEPLCMPNGPAIKKIRVANEMNFPVIVGDYRCYEGRNNHHVEVVEYTDSKGRTKREGIVVSMFESARRKRLKESVMKKDHGAEKRFICSLCANDTVVVEDGDLCGCYLKLQKFSMDGELGFRLDSDSCPSSKLIRVKANSLKFSKVSVSPIGEVAFAND